MGSSRSKVRLKKIKWRSYVAHSLVSHIPFTEEDLVTQLLRCHHDRNLMWPIRSILILKSHLLSWSKQYAGFHLMVPLTTSFQSDDVSVRGEEWGEEEMSGLKFFFLFQHNMTRTSARANFVARSSPTQLFATCTVQADVYHNLLKIHPWVMNLLQ